MGFNKLAEMRPMRTHVRQTETQIWMIIQSIVCVNEKKGDDWL